MNSIHTISHLHKTQFNIFIPCTPTSHGSTLSLSFSGYLSVYTAQLSHVCATSQTHLILFHLIYLKMFAKKEYLNYAEKLNMFGKFTLIHMMFCRPSFNSLITYKVQHQD